MKQIIYIFLLLLLVIGCSKPSSNTTPKISEADIVYLFNIRVM